MKNIVAKRYIFLCVIITIVFSFIMGRNIMYQNKIYKEEINSAVFEIVGLVKERYSDVPEDEIIKILNSEEFSEEGREIVEKYGITDEILIKKIEDKQEQFIITNILIILLFGIILILIFLMYLFNRKRRLII